MIIYLVVFITSALSLYLSRRIRSRLSKKVLVFIGILIPSLLAGLRSSSIGVDVSVYAIPFFERAKASSGIAEFFTYQFALGNTDIGFNMVTYIVSKFAQDYHWSLFFYQLITLTVVYAAFCKYEQKYDTPIWFVMMLYYLCLYNISLNIMKQTIAVAFVLLASTYLFEKKYKKYAICMVLGILFHSTALFGFVFLFMHILFQSKNQQISEREQLKRTLLFIMVVFIVLLEVNQITNFLVNIGVFRTNYLRYLSGGDYSTISEGRSISVITLGIQLVYTTILILHYRIMGRRELPSLLFIISSSFVLLFTCIGPLIAEYISRLSYYFVPIQISGLASTTRFYKKETKMIWMLFIVVFVFLTWLRSFVILGYGATVPYQFFWK